MRPTREPAGRAFRAIVPLRSLSGGKSRLAAVLPPAQRAELMLAMFEQVLRALRDSPDCRQIDVLSQDARCARPGTRLLPDAGQGLNPALAMALQRDTVRAGSAALAAPSSPLPVLVVAADLPLLKASTVSALLDCAASADVVVARDRGGSGSNALWLRDPAHLVPCFGADSAAQHLAAARARGLCAVACDIPELALDIDTEQDVLALRRLALPRFAFLQASLAAVAS